MTVDDYFKEVAAAVQQCLNDEISNKDYIDRLLSNDTEKLENIISIRKELLSPSDHERFCGYLEIGFFTNFKSSERIALFSFMFDIGNLLVVNRLENRFAVYDKNLKIFSKDSSLFDCIRKKPNGENDLELFNNKCLNNVQDTEVFERNNYYYQLEPFLNPSIFTLCKQNFKTSPIYIRLDPTKVYSSCPLFKINEAILIPANPNWLEKLNIHRRNKEGSSYFINPQQLTKDNFQEHWEYHIDGIRRLDVIAKRNGQGNLSMMLEELSERESNANITIGRCIHLDTDDEINTPFCKASLNHLDLAINIYEGQTIREERYKGNLASGKRVADATFRTHLLRIENLPFKSLLLFTTVFFKSKTLLNDWICDQFYRLEDACKT